MFNGYFKIKKSTDPATARRDFRVPLIFVILGLGTFFLYVPVVNHSFITYDDHIYVYANQMVQQGLTGTGFLWAFCTGVGGNWHPLTWLSHMLDIQLYGLHHPGGHHFTNVLFHLANTLLLFQLWRRITGAVWRSALLAAIFAWHPLHVESVAWVAERKDVLSTFFFLLTLLVYTRYVSESSQAAPRFNRWYGAALILFTLGLMSKPMVVTLPFVLMLLDFWPLQRMSAFQSRTHPGAPATAPRSLTGLVYEKIPFFLLSAAACLITYQVQKNGGNMQATIQLSWGDRLSTAMVGYVAYLKSAFWPVKLTVFYAYHNLPLGHVLAEGGLLALISVAVAMVARSRPYLLMGWCWFLGMLVPVIGLVPVGSQAYADRYMYLPLTGLGLALVWGSYELGCYWNQKKFMFTASAIVLLGLLFLTHRQVDYWKNSITLFNHALEVTPDNTVIENNLGLAFDDLGKYAEGEKYYKRSLEIAPAYGDSWHLLGVNLAAQSNYTAALECYARARQFGADSGMFHYNFGNALAGQSNLTAAAEQFQLSVARDPEFAQAHNNLGAVLLRLGRLEEAGAQFKTALSLQPKYPEAQDQLGHVLLKLGHADQALPHFREAVALSPSLADAQFQLGLILAGQNNLPAALGTLQTAVKLEPKNAQFVFTLAAVHEALHQFDLAADGFARAFQLNPRNVEAASRLASSLARQGKVNEAIAADRAALAVDPNAVTALQSLAWILATQPDAALRNGAEAINLARHADDLTRHQQPFILAALDAALAESGQFDEAIAAAQKTTDAARAANEPEIAAQALARIQLYKSGIAYRSPVP